MQINTVQFAVLSAVFEPSDEWHCPCGAGHEFCAYAAAHWDEELNHVCACGTSRDFLNGEVISVKEGE